MATAKSNVQTTSEEDLDSDNSWEDVEDDDDESEPNSCESLLLNSLILEKIFEFLPTPSLLNCRQVCREWNKTALMRRLLGSTFEISVSKANFDRLLKTAQNSTHPFCRKFDFRLVELEYDKVAKFIRLFGERLSSLTLKFCIASSTESVISILNCPKLEELKIYGALPEILEEDFHSFIFTRLTTLELNSSLDYGQVSRKFIKIILEHSPNLQTVNIGHSLALWLDFSNTVSRATSSKLCQLGLSGIEGPLEMCHFSQFFSKQLAVQKMTFQNSLVGLEFLHQFLQQTFKNLTSLNIEGTQQEIVSKAFRDVTLSNLQELSLPIDGVSTSEGDFILQTCPKLIKLKIIGLFQTFFTFEPGTKRLLCVSMHERYMTTLFSRANLQHTMAHEKRREFLKVLALVRAQPLKLEINLVVSHINSRCFRAIYVHYPDVEELVVISNSTKQCIVGLTGIPYRTCKRVAFCKAFSVLRSPTVRLLPSLAKLKKLKKLELTVLDETPSATLTVVFVLYGICEVTTLEELRINNLTMSDVAFMLLIQNLNLSACFVNGTENLWKQFQMCYKRHMIKSFLLPPPMEATPCSSTPEYVGKDRKLLLKILDCLDFPVAFEARKVCQYWHSVCTDYLHKQCQDPSGECLVSDLERRLRSRETVAESSSSPRNHKLYYLGEAPKPAFHIAQEIWSCMEREVSVAIISISRSSLEWLQLDNCRRTERGSITCQRRRQLEYWYYPDGSDDLIYPPIGKIKEKVLLDVNTLLLIGCWGRKDTALLEFMNPAWSTSAIHLIGIQKEALDLVLPKLTSMRNLESLHVKPCVNSSTYCELSRTHLQILCNASFKLKQLSMQLHAPADAVIEFVRSQRFTLESIELHSNVNISDRLTFAIPSLKLLKFDEPPGCFLWTTLNLHSNLETINFGRSGCAYNQVKNKSPKVDVTETDFEHSATDVLCDVNWFLDSSTTRRGVQKSILQEGSDSALRFFYHFPNLSSLTLRSVHAHYGILQGIFKKFAQLKKLELINATGVTDEILTGFSKQILDEMDILNPFQVARGRHHTEAHGKGRASIRNLKNLTHLSLDDQPACTDFSVIFGVLRLHQLQYFSCKKWKITDVALRAMGDILGSLKHVNTEGCTLVSKFGLEYFNAREERKTTIPKYNSETPSFSKYEISESGKIQKEDK